MPVRSTGGSLYDLRSTAANDAQGYAQQYARGQQVSADSFNRNLDQLAGRLDQREQQALGRQERELTRENTQRFAREQAAQAQEYAIAGEGRRELSMMGQNYQKKLSTVFEVEREFAQNNRTFDEQTRQERNTLLKQLDKIDADPTMTQAMKYRAKDAVADKLLSQTPWTPIQKPQELLAQEYIEHPGYGLVNPRSGKQLLPAAKSGELTAQEQADKRSAAGVKAWSDVYDKTGSLAAANAMLRRIDPTAAPLEIDEDELESAGGASRSRNGGAPQNDLDMKGYMEAITKQMGVVKTVTKKGADGKEKEEEIPTSFEEAKEFVDKARSSYQRSVEADQAARKMRRQPEFMQPIPPQPAIPSFTEEALQAIPQAAPPEQMPPTPEAQPVPPPSVSATALQAIPDAQARFKLQSALQDEKYGGKPVRVKTIEEAERLEPGTLFIAPDGKTRRKR